MAKHNHHEDNRSADQETLNVPDLYLHLKSSFRIVLLYQPTGHPAHRQHFMIVCVFILYCQRER